MASFVMTRQAFLDHFGKPPGNGSVLYRLYELLNGTLEISPYNVLTEKERASGRISRVVYPPVATMQQVANEVKADPTLVSFTITVSCGRLSIIARPEDYTLRRTLLVLEPEQLTSRDMLSEKQALEWAKTGREPI